MVFENGAQSNGVATTPNGASIIFALKSSVVGASLGDAANDLTGGNGSSNITVLGDPIGKLNLNHANDYAGNWTITSNATVRIAHAAALGTGTGNIALLGGGTLEVDGLTLTRNLSATGGTLRGTGTAAVTGTIAVTSGPGMTLATGTSAADVLTLGDSANDLTGGGSASNITVSGAGKVVLTQSSNYTGTWVVASGSTLEISADNQLGASSNVVDFLGVISTTASFTSARTFNTFGGAFATAAGTTLTLSSGLGGAGGSAALNKTGSGTLVLTTSAARPGSNFIHGGTIRLTHGSALGTGAITVNDTGTLELAGVSISNNLTLNAGSTLKVSGISIYTNSGNPKITNAAADVFLNVAGALDVLSIGSAIRSVSASPSSATIHVNGAGRLVLASGGTSASDIFGGSWEQSGGILQVGQSDPNSINGLGFKNGDALQANTITVNGGTLAVGVNSGGLQLLRANVILSGGSIASTNGVNGQYAGDFTTTPSATSKVLVFDPVATSTPRNVSLLGDAADTIQNATTWGANSTLIVDPGTTSGGIFTIARTGGTISVGDDATLEIEPGATVNLGGTADALSDGTTHVDVDNNSTATFRITSGSKNVERIGGVGNTVVDAGATLTATHIRQNALSVADTGRVNLRPLGTNRATSRVNTLELNATGTFDLANNKLVLLAESLAAVEADVISGRNGGGWDGTGIISSNAAAADGLTAVAVATAGDVGYGGTRTFGGFSVTSSDVLVAYTYDGDADLSGTIDGDDFFRIDQGYADELSGYANGDFNYSGNVDADDYFIIDRNYSRQAAAFSPGATAEGVTSVPEPASAAALALGLAALRRRRHH